MHDVSVDSFGLQLHASLGQYILQARPKTFHCKPSLSTARSQDLSIWTLACSNNLLEELHIMGFGKSGDFLAYLLM